jgi:hypothetical protein
VTDGLPPDAGVARATALAIESVTPRPFYVS